MTCPPSPPRTTSPLRFPQAGFVPLNLSAVRLCVVQRPLLDFVSIGSPRCRLVLSDSGVEDPLKHLPHCPQFYLPIPLKYVQYVRVSVLISTIQLLTPSSPLSHQLLSAILSCTSITLPRERCQVNFGICASIFEELRMFYSGDCRER